MAPNGELRARGTKSRSLRRAAPQARAEGMSPMMRPPGQAGEVLAREIGAVGFFAREFLPLVPKQFDAAHNASAV